ncbi:hypothetical protein [Desertibacillus haloalkaliphilus]|uniref:hypothetical protein n=1 Tax=Desertibacillus haloalkaliphilus TaxID=1328930 RepID=UPI001C27A109|nr:hypothetical protein [Desertibacillus haloalkaliphilus]MBU8906474.1 hypothetical protein [Desertibacillus haloalkaliphilus]
MYRIVSFFVIFSFVTVVLYFYNESRHHYTSNHKGLHEQIEIPSDVSVPAIDGMITRDYSGSWLLKVETENFEFAPEKAGIETESFHEGHAHLYINGEQLNRLYGEYYNIGELNAGTYEVIVSLHANNHGALTYNGEMIAFEETVEVEK